MKPKTRIALLCAMYPFESFLENGQEIIEYIESDRSSKKTSKRNRSEGAFKLSLGMGLVIQESGKKKGWVKGGPKYARTAIWGYVTTMIVMHAGLKSSKAIQPDINILIKNLGKPDIRHWLNNELIDAISQLTDVPTELASLRLHYAYARKDEVSFKRRTATGSRLVRRIYKLLTKEFVKKN